MVEENFEFPSFRRLLADSFWLLINSLYFAYFNKNWTDKTNKPYEILKKHTSKICKMVKENFESLPPQKAHL